MSNPLFKRQLRGLYLEPLTLHSQGEGYGTRKDTKKQYLLLQYQH